MIVRYTAWELDKDMFIRSFESLKRHTGMDFELWVYDGGLTQESREEILKKYPKVQIFDLLNSFKLLGIKEQRIKAWVGKVLLDAKLLNDKKHISIDADVYFRKRPQEIIDWIKNDDKNNLFMSDFKNSYMKNYDLSKLLEKCNSGLLCLQAGFYPNEDEVAGFFQGGNLNFPSNTFHAYYLKRKNGKRLPDTYRLFLYDMKLKPEDICYHFCGESWRDVEFK